MFAMFRMIFSAITRVFSGVEKYAEAFEMTGTVAVKSVANWANEQEVLAQQLTANRPVLTTTTTENPQ